MVGVKRQKKWRLLVPVRKENNGLIYLQFVFWALAIPFTLGLLPYMTTFLKNVAPYPMPFIDALGFFCLVLFAVIGLTIIFIVELRLVLYNFSEMPEGAKAIRQLEDWVNSGRARESFKRFFGGPDKNRCSCNCRCGGKK